MSQARCGSTADMRSASTSCCGSYRYNCKILNPSSLSSGSLQTPANTLLRQLPLQLQNPNRNRKPLAPHLIMNSRGSKQ
jgi:hypothetical protein